MTATFSTRFAPSPTGYLHLGHAYSALLGFDAAQSAGGKFLLRIENIDSTRCRPEFEAAIYDDLAWLGLTWEQPVRRQSDHMGDYRHALSQLDTRGLIYPCFCTRKDIAREVKASAHAPHGPDGALYPGTCRQLSPAEQDARKVNGENFALRLDLRAAIAQLDHQGLWPLSWQDKNCGEVIATPEELGDVVLARKDTPTSYHLSVVVDDALQGITHVIRGEDLYHATHIHRVLQALLGLDVPSYHHHPLLKGPDGKRFAKRNRSLTLQHLRSAGHDGIRIARMLRDDPLSILNEIMT